MGKILAIIAGLLALLSVGLFWVDEFLGSWWFTQTSGEFMGTSVTVGVYVNAFGTAVGKFGSLSYSEQVLGTFGLLAGVATALGGLLVLIGGASGKKAVALFGAVLIILGPLLFIFAFFSETNAFAFYDQAGVSFLYGSDSMLGIEVTWGLGPGFYIAIIAAILAFIGSAKIKN